MRVIIIIIIINLGRNQINLIDLGPTLININLFGPKIKHSLNSQKPKIKDLSLQKIELSKQTLYKCKSKNKSGKFTNKSKNEVKTIPSFHKVS